VALSIKNAEAERLAKALARENGTTVTASVIDALEQALRRSRGRKAAPSVRDAILEVSERCAALPDLDTRSAEEILGYDERGAFR
jgi:antitoxin VapB